LLQDERPLKQAASFLAQNGGVDLSERLWIGKTFYQPKGINRAVKHAAQIALQRHFADIQSVD